MPHRKGKYTFSELLRIDRTAYNRAYYEAKKEDILKQKREYNRRKKEGIVTQEDLEDIDFKNQDLNLDEITLLLQECKHALSLQQISDLLEMKKIK